MIVPLCVGGGGGVVGVGGGVVGVRKHISEGTHLLRPNMVLCHEAPVKVGEYH